MWREERRSGRSVPRVNIIPPQQSYDSTFKDWISQQATAILPLLLPGASHETALTIELVRPPMRVDKVFQVVYDGGKCLLHVEFETSYDEDLHSRLLSYNAMLYRDYKLPVITLVIYPFRVKTAKSPLCIQTPLRKKRLVTFCFETLLLFKLDARSIVQQHQTCLYPLLPTMKGVKADMIIQAMEELISRNHGKGEALRQHFVWMKILVERSSTILEKQKEPILRRLSMFNQLWEESKLIQKEREVYLAKGVEQGIEKGIEKGSVKAHQRDLLRYVEIRFPTLLALARNITAQSHSGEYFQSLLDQLYRANTIEEAQAVLLQG